MHQVRMKKAIKGKDIIDRLKTKYGTLDNLKKLHKEGNPEDSNTCFDLEEWDVHKDALDEDVKEIRVLFTEEPPLGKIELELLNSIKSDKPKSIEDLAGLVGKDIEIVKDRLNFLAVNDFIELKESVNDNLVPIFPYEYLQIVIGEVPISK